MPEYLVELAKHFGFVGGASAGVDQSRREFLRGLLATGVLAVAPSGLIAPPEPERKIFQVPFALGDIREKLTYGTIEIGGQTWEFMKPLPVSDPVAADMALRDPARVWGATLAPVVVRYYLHGLIRAAVR